MIFVRRLSRLEYAMLQWMTRQEIGRVSQRAHMILLSDQQRSVSEIAGLFGVSRTTVRFWIQRFEAAGLSGLGSGIRRTAGIESTASRPCASERPAHDAHAASSSTACTATQAYMMSRGAAAPEVDQNVSDKLQQLEEACLKLALPV